ncbi:MAG: type II toxin-antitoxin system RelE/ParE family toxin [Magnetococcales bacterium]|nr:type II toxin-antitoxin system RelE/ParE family toxin [Magnetococcales bacterium]
MIEILQTGKFRHTYKRLQNNQKAAVDKAVTAIVSDPLLGEAKKGDLADVYVYKFYCLDRLFLLAYQYDPGTRLLLLVGTHEKFLSRTKALLILPQCRILDQANNYA